MRCAGAWAWVVYTMHNRQCTISGAAGRCDLSGGSASPTQHRRLTSGRLRSPVWRRPPLLGPAVRIQAGHPPVVTIIGPPCLAPPTAVTIVSCLHPAGVSSSYTKLYVGPSGALVCNHNQLPRPAPLSLEFGLSCCYYGPHSCVILDPIAG